MNHATIAFATSGGVRLLSSLRHPGKLHQGTLLLQKYDKVCKYREVDVGAIERLTITLPAEMAGLVKGAVDEGDYASTSEVIREALRDWKLRRELRLGQLAELRADIARGLADVAGGRIADFDAGRIIARGRKLLADRSKFASPKQRKRI